MKTIDKPLRIPGLVALASLTLAVFLQPFSAAAQSSSSAALKQATDLAKQIEAKTGAAPAAGNLPAGDPCTIVSASDLKSMFPGDSSPERSHRLEKYGVTECQWKSAKGQVVLVVQQSIGKAGATAANEARDMAQGFVDPLKRQSLNSVRFEKFSTLGADNAVFVESSDAARGILSDGAFMALVNGPQVVTLLSRDLASQDRAVALKALERLGGIAAHRMK